VFAAYVDRVLARLVHRRVASEGGIVVY